MTITTTKSPQGRIRVSTSGITGMDKVVNYAFDVIDNGEDVILENEHGDTCILDDSLFLHGSYNVKFAIRQFAKGERVTGAIVLNGKEYPVVKAEDVIAEDDAAEVSEETADNKPVWEDPHKYETVGDLEHARYLYGEFNTDSNAGEVSEDVADAKPTLTRSQLQKMIDGVIAEREEYFDALDEYEADDECPQMHIDYLHDMIEKLGNQYWELVKLYGNAPDDEPPANKPADKIAEDKPAQEVNGKAFESVTINNETVTYINGEFRCVWSMTYDAGFDKDFCAWAAWVYFTDGSLCHVELIRDEEKFFEMMEDRGACTIDTKPTRPLVDAYYFDGGRWDLVTLEQEIVNHETLLFDKDDLLIIKGHQGSKIMFLPNGEIAFYLQPFDPDTHRYIDDFDRVDEDEFWLEMTERGLCTLEPVNNELVVADYEFTNNYNEFDEDCRRFLVNGEIITFSRDRWLEIYSPKICAKISRTMYLDTIRYDVDQWIYHKGRNTQLELAKNNISPAEFWAIMLRRGFMQRTEPFIVEINHCDEPPTFYEFVTLNVDYISAGNEKYHVCIFNHVPEIRIGTYTLSKIRTVINRINLAFANDAGITVDTNGEVAGVADYDVFTLDTCAEINRHAPEGWTITFDTQKKFFPVKFNGKEVTKLDSLATQKFLSPEKFFEQFKPLADENFTPKQQFLADRYNELAMLEQMREEIAGFPDQLKTLEEMIKQVKRDIAAEELAS